MRQALDLESHLNSRDKPILGHTINEAEYDEQFDKLLDKYPVPQIYDNILQKDNEKTSSSSISAGRKIPKNVSKL